MTIQSFFAKSTFIGIFWGVVGGISLIIATALTTNGYLQVVPYFFILFAAIVTTKYMNTSAANFSSLFKSGLLAFIISSICLYAYILTVINPGFNITFIGHLWRFAVIIAMGMAGSSILSFLAKPVK